MIHCADENKKIVKCSQEDFNENVYSVNIVKIDNINDLTISTIFSGHGDLNDNKEYCENPFKFNTLVFNKFCENIFGFQSKTFDEALKAHQLAINWVNNGASYGV